MARYGFGLLAPDIRASFSLSSGALGILAAASYVAYLATSVLAGLLTIRLGPRAIVAAGGACAVAGMTVAGAGPEPRGAVRRPAGRGRQRRAGVSPPSRTWWPTGWRAASRPRVLATISSGTGFGVCAAVPVALLVGSDWRTAWLLFALIAGAGHGVGARGAPGPARAGTRSPSPRGCGPAG